LPGSYWSAGYAPSRESVLFIASNERGCMNRSTQTYALLIGIDQYLPNTLQYECLKGCVRDVTSIEQILRKRLDLPDDHIIRLTAPNTAPIRANQLSAPSHRFPTYHTIVAAFQQLLEMATAGDHIYIYFAGHGARAASLLPESKAIDEVLVPMDIGLPEARYLHDVELAYILQRMGDAGLTVTMILDSCFAGGATRGPGAMAVRGTSRVDTVPRAGESRVASRQRLSQNWRALAKGVRRETRWQPDTPGYVLLAACRSSEQALEYRSGEHQGHGVFTYWLLEALQHLGPNATYRMLLARVKAHVRSEFEGQTPTLLGEAERCIFSGATRHIAPAVDVVRVDLEQQQVQIEAGEMHMVGKGAYFAIYPAQATDFSEREQCVALVKIVHLGGTTSQAKIVDVFRPELLESGAQAVLHDPGQTRFQRLIGLVERDDLSATIQQHQALAAVEEAIKQRSHRLVRLAEPQETVHYQVAINQAGEYEIWDPAGVLMKNICPALSINEDLAAEKLVRRLIHVTKYRNIQHLENGDPLSPLAGKLQLTFLGKQMGYEPGEQPEPEPLAEADGNPVVKPEEWIFLSIKNASQFTLNVTALNLAPDWSITQVFPYDTAYHTLAPGEKYLLELQAALPAERTAVTDTLKVFATTGSTDLRWLQLPALDHMPQERGENKHHHPRTPLEHLLCVLIEDTPGTRNLRPSVRPSREWITCQRDVDTRQDDPLL